MTTGKSSRHNHTTLMFTSLTAHSFSPERVRCGVDIVLHPGFTLTGSSSRPLLMRQQSKMTKVVIRYESLHNMYIVSIVQYSILYSACIVLLFVCHFTGSCWSCV